MLEGEILMRKPEKDRLVIICHPHPEFGGTMHNNVVTSLFKGLSSEYATARFNFAGVGNSTGMYEGGIGEVEQVRNTIHYFSADFLKEHDFNVWEEIHIIGYSFGAATGAPAAISMNQVSSFTGIAPPFELFPQLSDEAVHLQATKLKEIFLLLGDRDDFTTLQQFDRWKKKFRGPVESHVISDANHFFYEMESILLSRIRQFLNNIKSKH
jgi:hypothetical protein